MEAKIEAKKDSLGEIPAIPNLPPAGDARREELKMRADALEEKGEEQFKDFGNINPDKLRPDREILKYIYETPNMLAVTNQQPGFRYKWVFVRANGFFITEARLNGWIPVQGNDVEAKELRDESTLRRLGDTILMKISEEKYKENQNKDFIKRMQQQEGIFSEVEAQGGDIKGVTVHRVNQNPNMMRRLQRKSSLAQSLAKSRFDRMLREGTVPGMEM